MKEIFKEKATAISGVLAGLVIIGVLIGCIFVIKFLVDTFFLAEEYRRVYNNPIEVTGKIYKHDSYDDDGDDDYRSYVMYEVNGETYGVEFENKDRKEELTSVGKEVLVKVSPENPKNLISKLKIEGGFLNISLLLAILAVSLVYSYLINRKRSDINEIFLYEEYIRKDVIRTLIGRFRNIFWLLTGIVSFLLVYRYPMIYGERPSFGVCFILIWIVCFANTVSNCVKANRGEYEIHKDKLVNKKIVSDDDGDSYKLVYENIENGVTWEKYVSQGRYNSIYYGSMVYAVYLTGKKHPILHYDIDEKNQAEFVKIVNNSLYS